jgi:protein-S-isoprenylcysteine O-methyltransferase Ste14
MMRSVSLVLLGAWGLWCTLHSLLIANFAISFFRKVLGRGFRFYRLAYVVFSLGTLVPLIHFGSTLDQTLVLSWTGFGRLVPAVGLITAGILFVMGARHYDPAQFLGFRQIFTGATSRTLSGENHLVMSGILSAIRHPWYTATFLLLWSHNLTLQEIQINTLLSVYLVVGTLLEERKLVEEFGEHYRQYQSRVSMFFPTKWLLSRMSERDSQR